MTRVQVGLPRHLNVSETELAGFVMTAIHDATSKAI